jgi:hypothetical protein
MPEFFWVFLGGIALMLPFGYMATRGLDKLVRKLYEQHPEEWKVYGGPRGYFWKPSGDLPLTATVAFVKAGLSWPFRLPPPLAQDRDALHIQLMLRIGVVTWNVGIIALFILLHMRYGFPFFPHVSSNSTP